MKRGKKATRQSKQISTSQSKELATSQSKQIVPKKNGRPSKYSPEKIDILTSYLAKCEKANEIPLRETFALSIGVLPDTLAYWERDNKKFSSAIKKLDSAQKAYLMRNALDGTKKEATSIFLLKANHGMMETSRQEITGKDGKDLNINITAFRVSDNNSNDLPVIDGEEVTNDAIQS